MACFVAVVCAFLSSNFIPIGHVLPFWGWIAIPAVIAGGVGMRITPRRLRGMLFGMLGGALPVPLVWAYLYVRVGMTGITTVFLLEIIVVAAIGFAPGFLLHKKLARVPPDPDEMVAEADTHIAHEEHLRRRLIDLVNRHGDINDPATRKPLVTLEQFFEGNDDPGSIGYNLGLPDITPQKLYKVFADIRERPDVSDVLVEVKDMEDPDGWPSADTVWIITSAIPEEIERWLGHDLRGDDYFTGWTKYVNHRGVKVPYGHKPIGVWWD